MGVLAEGGNLCEICRAHQRFFRRRALLALDRRRFGKDVAAWERDVALPRETIDELPRHDFFDRA